MKSKFNNFRKKYIHSNYKVLKPFKKAWNYLEEEEFFFLQLLNFATVFVLTYIIVATAWYAYEIISIDEIQQNKQDTITAAIISFVVAVPCSFFYHRYQMRKVDREVKAIIEARKKQNETK